MNVPSNIDASDKDSFTQFLRHLRSAWRRLTAVLNGGVDLYYMASTGPISANIRGFWFSGTIPLANTNFVITHNLGYTPVGFITVYLNKNAALWTVSADNNTITIQSSVAATVVRLFVI